MGHLTIALDVRPLLAAAVALWKAEVEIPVEKRELAIYTGRWERRSRARDEILRHETP